MFRKKRSHNKCHVHYFCLVQSLHKIHCKVWGNRTFTYLLWIKISGPHSSGYMGSTSADTVKLTSPRSDARIWNLSTKFVLSLTQAKTVELSLTSSTPGESSKTIRTLNNNIMSAADWRHCNITVTKYKKNMFSVCNCSVYDVELHYIVQSSPVLWYGRRCRITSHAL
jgi:hypothetical protein